MSCFGVKITSPFYDITRHFKLSKENTTSVSSLLQNQVTWPATTTSVIISAVNHDIITLIHDISSYDITSTCDDCHHLLLSHQARAARAPVAAANPAMVEAASLNCVPKFVALSTAACQPPSEAIHSAIDWYVLLIASRIRSYVINLQQNIKGCLQIHLLLEMVGPQTTKYGGPTDSHW